MNIGQRIKLRARGGVPVRRYNLPHDMSVEVYQSYPGFAVVIEQHGRRWYACGFRTWGRSRYELSGGEYHLQHIGELICRFDHRTGGALAAEKYSRTGWGDTCTATADQLELRHQPGSYPAARSFEKLWKGNTQ